MNSAYHRSATNGHRHADTRHATTRYSSDKYDAHRQSTARAAHEQRDKDVQESAYASSSSLLINRDDIVLSYPEKTIPAKEPVISLDMEDDEEERIMQADWGNESDDEEATMQRQHKRLSTVEREDIERADRESKGVWVRHTADDGRLYYYNSVTRESVWEIPKNTTVTTAEITSTTIPTHTHATVKPATNSATTRPGSDRSSSSSSSSRPHKSSNDNMAKHSHQPPRSNSAPSTTASNGAPKEKQDAKIQVRARNDVSTNTNAEKGQKSNGTTKSTKIALQSSERRMSYTNRETSRENTRSTRLDMSHSSSHRSRYTSRRSRSRSPLPPPPPRDLYYDDYRYHHRSPSPPPYRHYPPYERYSDYYPYDDRIRYSLPPPPPPLLPPPHDLSRYRYYEPSPPPPLSPPPYYHHRSRERSWERYEAAHRSRYYR